MTVCVISVCPRQLQGDSLPWWPLLSVMDGGIVERLVVAVGGGAKGGRKKGGKDGAQNKAMDFISGQRERVVVWMEEAGSQEVKV